jgi:hypothetical protein
VSTELNPLPNEPLPTLEKIQALQRAMESASCLPPEPAHYFAPGMYMRELTIPKGMLVVGKIHKHAHFLILLKGRAQIVSEFGNDLVESGFISISPKGVKRVVLALDECTFLTVHSNSTNCEDLAEIEFANIQAESSCLSNNAQECLK